MKPANRKLRYWVAAVALGGGLTLGAAACGSGGGASNTRNAPTQPAPASTPTTAAPASGGAGF